MALNKLTSLVLTVCLPLVLSSCMATDSLYDVTHDAPKYRDTTQTMVSDILIAMGKPTQKIQDYEDSLVLVGNQHGYLIEPTSYNKQLFNNIFSQVDLSAVYINNQNINAEIKSSCNHKHGCGQVEISFIKEKAKLHESEEIKVKELNFHCQDKITDNTTYLICTNTVAVGFTVISQVNNFNSLQHTLKKPVNLKITKTNRVEVKAT